MFTDASHPVILLAVLAVTPVAAQDDDELTAALRSGTAGIEIRARYEQVDQDSFDDNAQATATRLRLNYRTGQWQNWSGFVEFDHVFNVLVDRLRFGRRHEPAQGR